MTRTFLQRIIARVFWKEEVARLQKANTDLTKNYLEDVGFFRDKNDKYFDKICRQEEYITRLKLRLEQLSRESRKNRINLP